MVDLTTAVDDNNKFRKRRSSSVLEVSTLIANRVLFGKSCLPKVEYSQHQEHQQRPRKNQGRKEQRLEKMKSFQCVFPRLQRHFSSRQLLIEGIQNSALFAPTSIAEPSSTFPVSLSKDNLLAASVSDILESKLAEIAPSARKHTFLKEIGYIGCTSENIAYLCKKDSPVLLPFEIRARNNILFLATAQFNFMKADDHSQDVFLVIVTQQEINFYEARPIEQGEVDFLSSFSVACPHDCTLTCIESLGTQDKHVIFGSNKGYIFELRIDGKNGYPVLACINEDLMEESKVRALYQEQSKGLLYALHENSTIEVFLSRSHTSSVESVKKVAEFISRESKMNFMELIPMPSMDVHKAHLLAVSPDGYLFNFELDLKHTKSGFNFFHKLMHFNSSRGELRLVHEESCLANRLLQSDGSQKKLYGVGFYGGLVLAVPVSIDGNHSIELWTASRLPPLQKLDHTAPEAPDLVLIKEPVLIDGGPTLQIHSAADDENSKLFEDLDLGADEFTQQIFQKGKKFSILADSQLIDVRKRCPVESLLEILHVQFADRLDEFFLLYGGLETATMAVQLAAARGEERAFQLLLDDSRLSTLLFASEGHDQDEISLPTQAIITYFRRLVSPLWNKSLLKVKKDHAWRKGGEDVRLMSNLSIKLLEWFESSFQEFDAFLERYIDEHQGIRFYDGTVFAPKCPSLLAEFQMLFELKDLVNRCKEMIQLIQIAEEYKPVTLDPHLMKILEKTTFATLAMTSGNGDGPLQRLMKCIPEDKDSEVQEAIHYRMDNELPALSRSKDKIYKKAMSLLMKAKSSPRPERQEKMVLKAMSLLGDQSAEDQIDKIVATLTDLQRHYEVLQFVSKTAKKLVPELPTYDAEVQKKALQLRQRVYGRAFTYVDNYVKNIEMDDASTDIPVLFGAVQSLADRHMMHMMLEKLLSSGKIPRAALHQPSYMEFGRALRKYLTEKLMKISTGLENPGNKELILSETCVNEMRFLVEICQSHGDFKMAGDWLMIIAKRSADKGLKIALIERIGDMNDARAMYDSAMPDTFLKTIEKEIEIGMFQHRMLTLGKKLFAIMDDRLENGEDVKTVLNKLATTEVLTRVIRENFPNQIAQDLTEELRKIVGDNNGYESDSTAFQVIAP